jgi:hypothetical protein
MTDLEELAALFQELHAQTRQALEHTALLVGHRPLTRQRWDRQNRVQS